MSAALFVYGSLREGAKPGCSTLERVPGGDWLERTDMQA